MKSSGRIGLFGGTFNPVHYAHLRAAEEVARSLMFDKVLFIPAHNPPLKKGVLASPEERLQMVRMAVEDNPLFEVSDIEFERNELSYSAYTLKELKERHPEDDLYFILGLDAFLDIVNWYDPESILECINLVVISRPPGHIKDLTSSPFVEISAESASIFERSSLSRYETKLKNGNSLLVLNVTPMNISATLIRNLLGDGKSIKYLLPEKVESFIMSNGLYAR